MIAALRIEPGSAIPIYEQIKRQIRLLIAEGKLKEGDVLPSIRELAVRLKVNPNTIVKAYSQLETEGFVRARQGSGYFVSVSPEKLRQERYLLFKQELEEFLSKASSLGFGPEDIIKLLKKRGGENGED